jgi:predicted transposase YbfD/YdcC
MEHTRRAVLAQTDVDIKTNEIARFQPLLEGLNLAGRIITADAMHTQREHADWLVTAKHAAYLLIVKANQPTLHHQLRHLPWREVPIADRTRDRGHGRAEIRRLQATTVAGLDLPHATQAIRITRRVRPLPGRRWRTVTVYAVTNLPAAQAHPARLADYVRGHWGIEASRSRTRAERRHEPPSASVLLGRINASAVPTPTATASSDASAALHRRARLHRRRPAGRRRPQARPLGRHAAVQRDLTRTATSAPPGSPGA